MTRVVEIAGLAAAYGGRLLAELGHDIIRVEPPGGDEIRRLGPRLGADEGLEAGAFHQFLNAGKRSLALDLALERSHATLLQLLATADALLAQAPLPVREERIRQANPALAIVRMEDPLPEICTYARSGLLALTGQPDGRPMLMGGHAAYSATGTFAAMAVLAALLAGEGETIDISAEECLTVLGEQGVIAETITHETFERRGYRGAVTAISGAFKCADGYAMLSVPPSPANWGRFMEWVQDPVLGEDKSLGDEAERRSRQKFVIDRLEAWTGRFAKEELVIEAQERHTPAAPVSTALDLVDDPQLKARGFLRRIEHPELGSVLFPNGALATVAGSELAPAPRLGQHNDEILKELAS